MNIQNFQDRSKQKSPTRIYAPGARNAAVMIPLVELTEPLSKSSESFDLKNAGILFEVRSIRIGQGGEICFPGGRIEPGENPGNAAVRESAEELLVPEEHIECIAPLHVLNGPGGSEITSFFGMIHGYKGTYSADEVSRVFALPVKWLLRQKPETYETEYRLYVPENFPYETIPGGRNYPWQNIPRTMYFYRTDEGVIWGLTAEVLYHFLEWLRPSLSC